MWLPAVEGTAVVQNRSFDPSGTPAGGLSVSPAARALSAASAAASACSGVSTRKALGALALVMRAEKASATSRAENAPSRTPSRMAAIPRSVRSVIAVLLQKQEIGRAHVCTPVTNAHLVCRLLLEKKKHI